MFKRNDLVKLLEMEIQTHRLTWDDVELTLKKSLDPTKEELEELLQWSCIYGYTNLALRILDEQINIDCETSNGKTPLILSAEKGYVDIVAGLLKKKANTDKCSTMGYTALMQACDLNYVDIVKLLLEAKANIKLTTNTNKSALDLAMDRNNTEVMELFK